MGLEFPALDVRDAATAAPYEQVRAQLAGQIADGTLPAGAKLPTVRALATYLGLAANTVARSYRELEAAGLVETRGRSGTFVGTAGQDTRQRAVEAARAYASTVRELGLDAEESLRIVRAAVEDATTG